ncbi:MAG: hypothetical protein NC191_01980 [Muribaculaceae bacterium]|nr:hypothetical protein [Muribaculaceae bacterium]
METIEINNFMPLESGENSYQAAALAPVEGGIEYEILSENKELEYIDYLNLTRVLEICAEFFDVNSAALAKDGFLSAVSLGSSVEDAYQKIVDNNPLAVLGSAAGFSKEVTLDIAKQLKSMNVKTVIAPKFSNEAVKYLCEMSEIDVVQIKSPLQELLGFCACDIKTTPFGYLVQEQNHSKLTKSSFRVAGKTKPTQQMAEDAIFAWKVCKYTKSNSAVIAKNLVTSAIVQGGHSQVCAAESALDFACENAKEAVLALDGVIDSEEVINAALQNRIGLIIESCDGEHSAKIAKLVDKYNLVLIKTGIRNNRF